MPRPSETGIQPVIFDNTNVEVCTQGVQIPASHSCDMGTLISVEKVSLFVDVLLDASELSVEPWGIPEVFIF